MSISTKKRYVFDLDGTLCEERPTFERSLSQPITTMIEFVNCLYDHGHRITIYTARSWAEYEMTEHWLKANSVRYHTLLCGKPIYDTWIDDRAINVKDVQVKNDSDICTLPK
jgi:hydroxymethylpyrimidine pyrophosphatase-like HAD family hydrolase